MPRNGRGRDMAKENLSGNRGEWSEPYAVLRLMADGKLYQANSDLLPDENDFACVLSVDRGDLKSTVRSDGVVVFSYEDENGLMHEVETHPAKLDLQASRLFKAICAVQNAKGSFELPSEAEGLKVLGFRRLTSPLSEEGRAAKRDLELKIVSSCTGMATLGFSVKSQLGAPPTLLNASEPTNILYRVKGLTKEQASAINAIDGHRKIMERCRAIKEQATSIEYESYHSEVFAGNLDIVDSALPQMIAELVKVHYFEQILLPRDSKADGTFRNMDRLDKAVELLGKTSLYVSKARKEYCEIKIKRFLRACALGLMPSKPWIAQDDASGGYILVLPDGRLVALFVYNTALLEKYLFESTIFERASTTRHKYLRLEPDPGSNDYLLKLNLQIRFVQ